MFVLGCWGGGGVFFKLTPPTVAKLSSSQTLVSPSAGTLPGCFEEKRPRPRAGAAACPAAAPAPSGGEAGAAGEGGGGAGSRRRKRALLCPCKYLSGSSCQRKYLVMQFIYFFLWKKRALPPPPQHLLLLLARPSPLQRVVKTGKYYELHKVFRGVQSPVKARMWQPLPRRARACTAKCFTDFLRVPSCMAKCL